MSNYILCDSDYRLLELIWEHAPVPSGQLVKLCQARLGWKKSTTYTQLKRLCDKGIFQNDKGMVTSLISKKDYYAGQSTRFVEESFGGSLPAFLAAFTSKKKLSDSEIAELQRMIDDYKED